MKNFAPTIIWRHKKENLKKCSLKNLESREDLKFYTYPKDNNFDLTNYIVLTINAPVLTKKDCKRGLFLIDGTWKYAEKMSKMIPNASSVIYRSLPEDFVTAYPRKQTLCPDPTRGLATVEALYIAYFILGRDRAGLLDHYHFKDQFLQKNLSYLC